MAITAQAIPQTLTPAYNPIKYIYDSTNKNLGGFKYIFDIYESGTANKIAEYRVLPMYSTGYGEIDLSKLLQSKVALTYSHSTPQHTMQPIATTSMMLRWVKST
jgi:ABC-type glycerol-3-phosphate transport system substrate-binding protein